MQIELTRDEAVAIGAACEDQDALLAIIQKRTNGMNVSRAKAIFAVIVAKMSDAVDADVKREQAEAKTKQEAAEDGKSGRKNGKKEGA